MTQTGTLEELNVNPGDVVECVSHSYTLDETLTIGEHYTVGENYQNGYGNDWGPYHAAGLCGVFRIVSRSTNAPDTPTWGEMTDAEKGALLLAQQDGKMEGSCNGTDWGNHPYGVPMCVTFYYRIKPEPVVETVALYGNNSQGETGWTWGGANEDDTHLITFTTTDGKPDCDSIKMERINE